MGIGRRREVEPDQAERKQNVLMDETKIKDVWEDGVVQQRKSIDSRKVCHSKELETFKEGEGDGVVWSEKEKVITQPISGNLSLNEDDKNARKDVLQRPKSYPEGKGFIISNSQDVNGLDSRSKNTYVKLWAQKGPQRNDQTPKKIRMQIGSLSCGDTVRFLEAEKARVIEEIREEQEKRLGCGRDRKGLIGTQDKAYEEVEDSNGMAMYIVHDCKEGKAVQSDTAKSGKQLEEEPNRAGHRAAEIREKRQTERVDSCSQELRSLPIAGAKVKQQPEKELRAVDENKAQLDAKATRWTGQENTAGVLRGVQFRANREQVNAGGPKGVHKRPPFETVKKTDRRAIQNSTFPSCPPSSRDSKSYKSFQADKRTGNIDNPRTGVASAETDKGRAVAKQGEGEDDERELQKRALYHLEALRRIEESYNKKTSRERNDNFRTMRQNETPYHHPGYWDTIYTPREHETQKNQFRKLQKNGKGGLNALLAPVFEEELHRQFQDYQEDSPTNSVIDKRVAVFQRMKRARLKAADEQLAAAKARGQQIRAQLKVRPQREGKLQALETQVHSKDKRTRAEGVKPQKDNFSTSQAQQKLLTYTPSVKRTKEFNEKARAEAELTRERQRRAKLKEQEQRATMRREGPGYSSVQLYDRLNRVERHAKLDARLQSNSRFKSPFDSSQKWNCNGRFKQPELRPQTPNSRLQTRLASPRRTPQTNALEHFANWEKELRTAQRSKSLSKERSKEKRVVIMESPKESAGKTRSPELTSGSGEKALISMSNKSTPRKQSPVNIQSSDPVPDHYGSIENCTYELKQKKEKKERNKVKVTAESPSTSPKEAHRKENCQSLNWLGKLYNTITSFS